MQSKITKPAARQPEPPRPWERSYPRAVDWQFEGPLRPLGSLLDDAVAAYPERPCIEFLGRAYSYAEIGLLVDRAAEGFRRLGVVKGTRVGLLLPNSPYFVICFFAVLKLGGIVTTFNLLLAEEEVRQQIVDSETGIIVTLDLRVLYEKVAPALSDTPLHKVVVCRFDRALPFWKGLAFRILKRRLRAAVPDDDRHLPFAEMLTGGSSGQAIPIDPNADPAAILYTAGTTGHPKGVTLSHASLLANALQSRRWFTKAEAGHERILAVLPFFHAFGLTGVMNFALSIGSELIVLPRFDAGEVLTTIRHRRPTFFSCVPTMLRAMLQHPDFRRTDFFSLKVCVSGGDSLPAKLREEFEARSGTIVTEGYGLSECAPVVTCGNPLEGADKPGSVGLPLPGTEVEIVSLEDHGTSLPTGKPGEVCIRGPQLMLGYWKQPDLTAEVMAAGRLRSGDVGYLDEDGFLFITDRLKEVIVTGGYTVYPSGVEEALCRHDDVAEAAVVGVPDAYWGEVPKAFIVPAPGRKPTAEALAAFLEGKVSPMEEPKSFVFLDHLPKSAIGKVLKRELKGP